MLRNIGLTVLAMFLCNLLLTLDLTTSLLSLAVVGLTVTDTVGISYFWGLHLNFNLTLIISITTCVCL
jgi:hypothetical protein